MDYEALHIYDKIFMGLTEQITANIEYMVSKLIYSEKVKLKS